MHLSDVFAGRICRMCFTSVPGVCRVCVCRGWNGSLSGTVAEPIAVASERRTMGRAAGRDSPKPAVGILGS